MINLISNPIPQFLNLYEIEPKKKIQVTKLELTKLTIKTFLCLFYFCVPKSQCRTLKRLISFSCQLSSKKTRANKQFLFLEINNI